jgi:hypothetical protein
MPGEPNDPYREPCGGWANENKKVLGCGGHYVAAHKAIPRLKNTTLASNAPCEPETEAPPEPRPIRSIVPPFQSDCEAGEAVGKQPVPFPVNTYALPPEDEAQTVDFTSCDKRRQFKTAIAAKQWHGKRGFSSHHLGARFAKMNGDQTCQTYEGANNTPDPTKYLKLTVSARELHTTNTDGTTTVIADYSLNTSCEVNRFSGKVTGSRTEFGTAGVAFSDMLADVLEGIDNGHNEITTFYALFYTYATGNEATYGGAIAYTDGTSPSFDYEADFITHNYGTENNTVANHGEITFGDSASASGSSTLVSTTDSDRDGSYSTSFSHTISNNSITFHWEETNSQNLPGGHNTTSSNTRDVTISLSTEYTWTEVIGDLSDLLSYWKLGDDTMMPWRNNNNNANALYDSEVGNSNTIITGGPLIKHNSRIEAAPFFVNVGGIPADDGPEYPELPDGGIVGKPLDTGSDPYFDFNHTSYKFTASTGPAGSGIRVDDEFYGQESPWPHATLWLNNVDCRYFPSGPFVSCGSAIKNPEWVDGVTGEPFPYNPYGVIMCKYALSMKDYPSHNFFRPCGADRDHPTFAAASWPICGRILITSATQNAGNVDIVLSEAAANLITGDLVDFTGVAGLGTALSVTVVDSTHFSVAGTLTTSPTLSGYVSSNGAPSYEWNDTQSKHDFVVKEYIYDFRDFYECLRQRGAHRADLVSGCDGAGDTDPVRFIYQAPDVDEANEVGSGTYALKEVNCTQYCLKKTLCDPAVIYVSPNTEAGHANCVQVPMPGTGLTGDDLYGTLWLARPELTMADPINGERCEARCSVPTGAPALPTGAITLGCVGYVDGLNEDPPVDNSSDCESHYSYELIYDEPSNAYWFAGRPIDRFFADP